MLRHALPLLLLLAPSPLHAQTAPDEAAITVAIAAACGSVTRSQILRMAPAKKAELMACHARVSVDAINKGMPEKIDDVSTVERLSADGGRITYHVRLDMLRSEVASDAMEQARTAIREELCRSEEQEMFGYGMSLRYLWTDRTGAQVSELIVAAC